MSYLVIMVAVAVLGLVRLAVMHRRERTRLSSIDGFRSSLAAIEAQTEPRARAVKAGRRQPVAPANGTGLDPARRAAAKRRIQARRRAHRARAMRASRARTERERRARARRPRVAG